MRRILTLLAGSVTLACASATTARIPILAGGADIGALAGEWGGEYDSPETGRSGSILFRLTAGRDTAQGDVVMVPRALVIPQGAQVPADRRADPVPRASATVLTITFVRLDGNRVSGVLDPYQDPECGCVARTTFVGELRGNRVSGTFTTRRGDDDQRAVSGTWTVTRTR